MKKGERGLGFLGKGEWVKRKHTGEPQKQVGQKEVEDENRMRERGR